MTDGRRRRQLLGGLVQPIALNHPLRADTDIRREQALQHPLIHAEAVHEIFHLQDRPISCHRVDDLCKPSDVLVRSGPAPAKKVLDDRDAGRIRAFCEDGPLQRAAFRAEHVTESREGVRECRNGHADERMESPGLNFAARTPP